ncbi:LPXTG cell wall anchor domain-containing protein [Streptomyces sp. SKN60]|uniref:LPXTG cell wall anchor domain-containing protein n=1 Tax=Streptomyces sp. SKN60 TaxID=2855506 RepID=UPI0022486025|nr:LPXTG cell wall anchor domain-containing protein [Streptomyces sp. SKN60]MCX2181006.1 LPXTG cell wall anchor domain-containing protein [Streptomyces sp. SKN60]
MFLSAAPAFADQKPATQTQDQNTDIEKLKLAVAKAQAAYDAAVVAAAKLTATLDELAGDKHPLVVAFADAEKASKDAAAAKTAADAKLEQAEKDLAALPAEATEEQKTAARQAVTAAETEAATAKTTAETKAAAAKQALKALNDARMAALGELTKAQDAKKKAAKELDEAKDALREAEEAGEPDGCEDVSKTLTVHLDGPKEIAAGTSGDFSLRVTNRTGATVEEPDALLNLIDVASGGGNLDEWFDLKASVGGAPWVDLDEDSGLVFLKPIKNGATADVKVRVAVNSKAPKAFATLTASVGYDAEDGTCGWGGEGEADFTITKGAAKPGKPAKPAQGNGNTTAQGGSSTTPVTTHTGGTLAATGAGSATMPIALAGGAAVVLGAGAMVVVRRRKAGSDA